MSESEQTQPQAGTEAQISKFRRKWFSPELTTVCKTAVCCLLAGLPSSLSQLSDHSSPLLHTLTPSAAHGVTSPPHHQANSGNIHGT